MRKVLAALAATAAGVGVVVAAKADTAGTARSALAGSTGHVNGGASAPAEAPTASSAPTHGSGGRTTAPAHAASGTYTGGAVDTPYGTMQVAAVVSAGRLTDVTVLQETDGGRSTQIDREAVPILRSEAISAQSANIDVVSGATYTSQGYAQSLQSALDKAGI